MNLPYYIFGFLPSLFFALRFLIQWLQSEKKRRSYVSSLFWKLSFVGNFFLALHFFIQYQFPFCLLQVVSAFIAWRNLNIASSKRCSLKQACSILLAALALTTLLFVCQKMSYGKERSWLDIPLKRNLTLHFSWHLLGIFGNFLFSARFWIQWIEMEKKGISNLDRSFWFLSIAGSCLALIYFVRIGDLVGILNYATGFIPYIRNLMLLNKKPSTQV